MASQLLGQFRSVDWPLGSMVQDMDFDKAQKELAKHSISPRYRDAILYTKTVKRQITQDAKTHLVTLIAIAAIPIMGKRQVVAAIS